MPWAMGKLLPPDRTIEKGMNDSTATTAESTIT
jgi:hypothetical protein